MRYVTRNMLALVSCAAWAWLAGSVSAQTAEEAQRVVSEPPELPSEEAVQRALSTGAAEQLASEAQQALLGEWMEATGRAGRRVRLLSGANQLIASSIVMGTGIALFVTDAETELDKGVGLALVGFSGVFMSLGIAQLVKHSQAELRLERWSRASTSRLTMRELGRFEGELRAQSETLDRSAKIARWSSFGMAMTGALILGLTPAANLSTNASTGTYIAGGVMAGFGLLAFGLSFVGGGESSYDAYSRGQRPLQYSKGVTVRGAPAVGRNFAGAQLVGRF